MGSTCTEGAWSFLSSPQLGGPSPNSPHFENSTVGKKTFTTVTHLAEKFVVELTDFWCVVVLLQDYFDAT